MFLKVLDGIAGSAKSTLVDNFFKERGEPYLRLTSTNQLKRDAIRRFGGTVDTIAGALFTNTNGSFYVEAKEISGFKNLVIDEVLQTSSKVFDWILDHKDDFNIFVCTDSHQMLAPRFEKSILKKFNDFISLPDVEYIQYSYTFRPKTDYTRAIYDTCYNFSGIENTLWKKYRMYIDTVIPLSSLLYKPDCAYITHTNLSEKHLYDKFDLYKRYDLNIIQKGSIARQDLADLDISRYPILNQLQAGSYNGGYFQIANIGTVQRFQGSEVEQGHTLYYIINKPREQAFISNREFYTLVTRAKDFNDIVLVEDDIKDPEKIKTFLGAPVKTKAPLLITKNTQILVNDKAVPIGDSLEIPKAEYDRLLKQAPIEDRVAYTYIVCGGKIVKPILPELKVSKSKITIASLLKKDPQLACECMDTFYKKYEECIMQAKDMGIEVKAVNKIKSPINVDYKTLRTKRTDEFHFYLDLYSSYPHCFKYGKLPNGSSELTDCEPDDLHVGFYLCYQNDYCRTSCVITDFLYSRLKKYDPDFPELPFIGSLEALPIPNTLHVSDILMQKAYQSKATKQNLSKSMKYGILYRPYLKWDSNSFSYVIDKKNVYEPLMVAIQSTQAGILLDYKYAMFGTIKQGKTLVDALYFDDPYQFWQLESLGKKLLALHPNFDFRIRNTMTKNVLYQTYKDPLDKKHLKSQTLPNLGMMPEI